MKNKIKISDKKTLFVQNAQLQTKSFLVKLTAKFTELLTLISNVGIVAQFPYFIVMATPTTANLVMIFIQQQKRTKKTAWI